MKGSNMPRRLDAMIGALTLCLCLSLSGAALAQQDVSDTVRLGRFEGYVFEAGEVLVSLDDHIQSLAVERARLRAESQAEVRVAQARVNEAQVELDHQQELAENGSATPRDVLRARAALDVAQAEHDLALENQVQASLQHAIEEQQLTLYTIRAPFAGQVLRVATEEGAEEGAALRQNDPIMHIAQLDPIVAKISLPADMAGRLSVGEGYRLSIGGLEGATPATLTRVSNEVDRASQLVEIVFEIDNPEGAIRSGARFGLIDLDPR